jgi:hypothetical protein
LRLLASPLLVELEAEANLRIRDKSADLTMAGKSQVIWLYSHFNRYHVYNNMFDPLLGLRCVLGQNKDAEITYIFKIIARNELCTAQINFT